MLRLWRVETEDGPAWRASVESPHTGERVGFGSLMGRTNPFYKQGHALAGGVAFYMTARISARGRSAGWSTSTRWG
jgi:hypothetical protein